LISADASSLIAYFNGVIAPDTDAIAKALSDQDLWLAPAVIVELLGTASNEAAYDEMVNSAPLLPLNSDYWIRAREMRRLICAKGLKARAMDTLIAQCCIDADVPLIARDSDFRHFAQWCGLKLAL